MGIQVAITLPNGVTVNYHRIAQVADQGNQTLAIQVESYVTQAIREAGSSPVQVSSYFIDRTGWDTAKKADSGAWKALYTTLKALPFYAGATDC
jgi:hypothetical protein